MKADKYKKSYPRKTVTASMKKIALITGASSGIGREFVRKIAAGYPSLNEIWILARREEALKKLAEEFPGIAFKILALDLTKTEDLNRLEQLLKQTHPCIRILVNSAGMGKNGPAAEQDWHDGCAMIDLNCRALTAVTMLCLPYLRKGSRIIQVDSGAAFLPQPGFAIYAASKAYVLSFDRALHEELKDRGITVTSVCPGPVDTPFFASGGIHLSPAKQIFLTKPEKVAKKALFDAEAGRPLSIPGFSMRIVRAAGKLLPHSFLLRLMRLLQI